MALRLVAVGLGLCFGVFFNEACSTSAQKAAKATMAEAVKAVTVSRVGDRTVLSVAGSGKALRRVGGRVEYVPIEEVDVELAIKGHVFVFEPIDDSIMRYICAFSRVDEISVWYGSFSSDQRECILQRFPGCVIYENLNKI
jgi:hypothetical protein